MTTACKYAETVINSRPEIRKITNKLLEQADEGLISYRDLAVMALKWMSEYSVWAMCQANEIFFEEPGEDDEEDPWEHDDEVNYESRLRCR